MQDLAHWLEKLGMSEYTQSFVANGIDFTALPGLSDQDLKDIGVLLGHRRKLLRAIAELKGVEKGEQKPAPSAALVRAARHASDGLFAARGSRRRPAAGSHSRTHRRSRGCSAAAVALAWTIRNGKVIAIPESGSAAHVKENAVALALTAATTAHTSN